MKKNLFKAIYILMISVLLISNNFSCADDIDEEEYLNSQVIIQESDEVSNIIKDTPIINSRKGIIYDRETKRILYGKNENTKCAMASTTKIMTCIIVLENANLNKQVIIDEKAASTGGSRLGLKKEDKITIHDLLYGLMLKSGNDAAVALAIEIAGSVEGFADMMNEKAKDLSLENTHFVTPHGLDNSEHYTTAFELAELTDYALRNKKFCDIVRSKSYIININGYSKKINNTNELLGTLNGVVGVKTGFTNGAGRCLVTETKRNDNDFIVIVLGADTKKDRTKDSIKLIEYAYSCFQKVNLEEKASEEFENWKLINESRIEIIKGKKQNLRLKLANIKNKNIPMKIEDIDKTKFEINITSKLEAPLEENEKVGTLIIKSDKETLETVDVLIKEKIGKKNILDYFQKCLNTVFKNSIL